MSIFDAYRTGEIVDLEQFIPVSDYFLRGCSIIGEIVDLPESSCPRNMEMAKAKQK